MSGSTSSIHREPTDPDTLKILGKIEKEFYSTESEANDPGRLAFAREEVNKKLADRATDPERQYVNPHIILDSPTDNKVTKLRSNIASESATGTGVSLEKRIKPESSGVKFDSSSGG